MLRSHDQPNKSQTVIWAIKEQLPSNIFPWVSLTQTHIHHGVIYSARLTLPRDFCNIIVMIKNFPHLKVQTAALRELSEQINFQLTISSEILPLYCNSSSPLSPSSPSPGAARNRDDFRNMAHIKHNVHSSRIHLKSKFTIKWGFYMFWRNASRVWSLITTVFDRLCDLRIIHISAKAAQDERCSLKILWT